MVILAIASMPVLKPDLHDEKVTAGIIRACTVRSCTLSLSILAVSGICEFAAVFEYGQALK